MAQSGFAVVPRLPASGLCRLGSAKFAGAESDLAPPAVAALAIAVSNDRVTNKPAAEFHITFRFGKHSHG
jgi:hypothetical protein